MNRLARIMTAVALSSMVPLSAEGAVRKEGSWPASDKKVSLEFDGKPSDGLTKLANEAGWSLVVSKGIAIGEHDVKIDVDDQPADAVLEALFSESNIVARRSGSLITITRAEGDVATAPALPGAGAVPAVPAIPSVPPVPTVRGDDRNVLGASLTVAKGEVVHTVTVTGGSAQIHGIVTGDLIIAGGSAKIVDGGRVVGNVTVFGGSLKVESGGRIDGDVGIVGGALKRDEGAIIGGKVVNEADGRPGHVKVSAQDGKVSTTIDKGDDSPRRGRVSELAHHFGNSVTSMSLLFVLGCVLLALATRKMETLRGEIAARPMKAFAMGIVGSFGAVVALVALCITVVGIPFAALAVLVGVFAVYGAICSVLTVFGAAVAGHKTKNPYIHLLVGCIAFLLVGLVPYIGGFVTAVVVMIAIGTLVSTRLAGVVERRRPKPDLV